MIGDRCTICSMYKCINILILTFSCRHESLTGGIKPGRQHARSTRFTSRLNVTAGPVHTWQTFLTTNVRR
ncbi:hypothetical protein BIW11_10361 [Tropilaelaps mercedesae]|uniref:Uncharacterized protein n=1 Tax=Tropilaelaps mercedesae TaxID=418985 RepID=A0A1V9XGB5_9ACAR|nr:hypothetical protein BIW11_10361 [Tropilaelaps mercedesae]